MQKAWDEEHLREGEQRESEKGVSGHDGYEYDRDPCVRNLILEDGI